MATISECDYCGKQYSGKLDKIHIGLSLEEDICRECKDELKSFKKQRRKDRKK